jgi:quercetin dioxygenase-like cupin family protein
MALSICALGSEEGPAVWFLNTLSLIKATASQTGGAFGLIEQLAPVGAGSPYHVHRAEDESFYILKGELEFINEGRRFVKGPGAYVFLPRHIPHGFRVVGASTSRFLILTTPGGFEGFVTEMASQPLRVALRARRRRVRKSSPDWASIPDKPRAGSAPDYNARTPASNRSTSSAVV